MLPKSKNNLDSIETTDDVSDRRTKGHTCQWLPSWKLLTIIQGGCLTKVLSQYSSSKCTLAEKKEHQLEPASKSVTDWTNCLYWNVHKTQNTFLTYKFFICILYTKHKTHFVCEYKKSYKQKVKTECTQTLHKSTYPNIDEIEPNYGFWILAFEIFCF